MMTSAAPISVRAVLSIAISVAASVSTSAHAQAVLDKSAQVKVDEIVRSELKAKGVPSASIAIVVEGKVAVARAYGDAQLEPARPAAPAMRYCIGSVSKQFLATAMLMLEQEGRLDLDDKVAKYYPDLGAAGEATLRQLLSHTSGIRDYWPQDYVMAEMRQPITREHLIDGGCATA